MSMKQHASVLHARETEEASLTGYDTGVRDTELKEAGEGPER